MATAGAWRLAFDLVVITGLTAEARIAAPLGPTIAAGGTRDAARRVVLPEHTQRLLSFGLAGGLDPALRPGTLVIPRHVITDGDKIACDAELLAWLGGPTCDAVLDAPDIVATSAAKHALFRTTGAAAIDLESGEVARRGLPFAVLRAVCDPADETLPPAALRGLTEAGGIDMIAVLGSLMRQPTQLSALLRLGRHANRARSSLKSAVTALKKR